MPKEMPNPPGPRVIYWFRTDLRLHDSPALHTALSLSPSAFYPLWTWDPHYVYRARVGSNRWQYLLDCQADLSASLTRLNPKSKLFVVREAPQTLFRKLFKEWEVTHLVFEKDTDAYARGRDEEVRKVAGGMGVQVVSVAGRTLWDSDEVVRRNGNRPTMSIKLQAAGKKIGPIPRPIPAPTSIPDPGDTSLSFEQERPSNNPDINSSARNNEEASYTSLSGPNNDFGVPTMSELGLKPATTPHRGGETLALETLDSIIANEEYTATFAKPNTAPTAFSPQATTLLSPHLHFGSLSVREFYWRVQDVVDAWDKKQHKKGSNVNKKATQPPTSLTGQLLFRDMYFAAQASLGFFFGQTYKNAQCRFIPWHLPSKIDTETGLITGEYQIDSAEAELHFQRWKTGTTGFPWIDALMRQLRSEGWIHHLGRHAVACFLTRGGCYIDWERGAEVFEELLIDHEAACNAGNWQWLSCTAFFSQFFRCYSPIAFPQKWDKEGEFVRRYVPELKGYDRKYIYEPWKAPVVDQKRWGCVVRPFEEEMMEDVTTYGDEPTAKKELAVYPKPIFDFPTRREIGLSAMKTAYSIGLHGADEKVLNGTWRELFKDSAEGPTEGEGGLPGAMLENEEGEPDGEEEFGHGDREGEEDERVDGDGKEKKGEGKVVSGKKGKASKGAGKSIPTSRPKREASQSTLDGMFTRKKKKDDDGE